MSAVEREWGLTVEFDEATMRASVPEGKIRPSALKVLELPSAKRVEEEEAVKKRLRLPSA